MHYFTHTLVINTMGYLTGIGEITLYEIYQVCSPKRVLILEGLNGSSSDSIRFSIEKGHYKNRLLFSGNSDLKTTSKFFKHVNIFAEPKDKPNRFETLLVPGRQIRSLDALIVEMLTGRLKPLKETRIFNQGKDGLIQPMPNDPHLLDMRVVIIGEFWGQLIKVLGVGYGWNGRVYSQSLKDHHIDSSICLLTDNIDM